ncbi:putative T-complex protein 1 subunit delta [Blattamonas nauphoetae]|nr:putative T-complex protein 1 subunit delta [Blattamonas nauphoetae]
MAETSFGSGADRSTKAESILVSNMLAAISVSDTIRTSLGPRGMDKMITGTSRETTITNDGATILSELTVMHPCAKMLVEMSHAQDVEAGDGTTSVVVIAGALLSAAHRLVQKGLHPNVVSRSFGVAISKAEDILKNMSLPVDLSSRDMLVQSCVTSLSSKMVSANAKHLAELSVDAVLAIKEDSPLPNADLKRIKVIKQLGAPVDSCELIQGLALSRRVSTVNKGPTHMDNAKVALIQFCISPPKTDMDVTVVVGDAEEMRRTIEQERRYIIDICKKVKESGANVLLVQKSILRDAIDQMGRFYLAKLGVMVVEDIERDEVDFICRALHCLPFASVDHLVQAKVSEPHRFGYCERVEQVQSSSSSSYVKFTGVKNADQTDGKVVSLLCCGPNSLMLEETDRSIHDSLCVARALVKKRALLPGGGAAETELSVQLNALARSLSAENSKDAHPDGLDPIGVRAFAEALEQVPLTLAENAGLNPIQMMTQLRAKHAQTKSEDGKDLTPEELFANKHYGVNIRTNSIGNMVESKVVQPLLVTLSAVTLATETVRQILRIDDIVAAK